MNFVIMFLSNNNNNKSVSLGIRTDIYIKIVLSFVDCHRTQPIPLSFFMFKVFIFAYQFFFSENRFVFSLFV